MAASNDNADLDFTNLVKALAAILPDLEQELTDRRTGFRGGEIDRLAEAVGEIHAALDKIEAAERGEAPE